MKKTNLAIAISCAAMLGSSAAMANGPKFTGEMGMGGLKVDGRDLDAWAYDLRAGVAGSYKFDGFAINYQFTADFGAAANNLDPLVYSPSGSANDIYVRDAKIVVPTRYGAFVVAPRSSSGQFAHIYGATADFEYNAMHARTGINGFFTQGDATTNLLAYATPKFAGWQVIFGSFTFNKANDRDIDAWSYRALYKNGGFDFAVGQVFISDKQAGSGEKEERNAASVGYSWDSFKVSAVVEQNDVPDGLANDFTTWAARVDYKLNERWSSALAYVEKDHELDSEDNDGMIFQVKRHLNDQVYLFAETGQYDVTPSNYAVGVNVKF